MGASWLVVYVTHHIEQMFGFVCCNYSFVNPSRDVLHLGVLSMRWCMFVNKSGQGSVILFVGNISFLG